MKTLSLPLVAVLLVAGVLGVQIASGGGDYVPRRSADPCQPRPVPPIPARLEPLAERIVLLGLDGAACRRGISRERLVLSLAETRSPNAATAAALKAGLRDAVNRLDREQRLPKVSQLLPELLDESDLPGIVKALIKAIPDGTVDRLLPTAPLLRRSIDKLDVRQLIRELDDPHKLDAAIRSAVTQAARDEALDRLRP